MTWLWGYPGWGWHMYGLARLTGTRPWFIGFSRARITDYELVEKTK